MRGISSLLRPLRNTPDVQLIAIRKLSWKRGFSVAGIVKQGENYADRVFLNSPLLSN